MIDIDTVEHAHKLSIAYHLARKKKTKTKQKARKLTSTEGQVVVVVVVSSPKIRFSLALRSFLLNQRLA